MANDTEHGLTQPMCELKKWLWLPHQKQILKEYLGTKSFKLGRAHNWRLKCIAHPTTSETSVGLILPTARRYKLERDSVMTFVSYAPGSCWGIFNGSMRQTHGKLWGRRFLPLFQRFAIKFCANRNGLVALRACEKCFSARCGTFCAANYRGESHYHVAIIMLKHKRFFVLAANGK